MKASMDQYSFKVLKIVTGKFSQKKKKSKQTNKPGAFTTKDPTAAETYIISLLSDFLPENKSYGEWDAATLFHPMEVVDKITDNSDKEGQNS